MGGLMKLEAKCYLETILDIRKQDDDSFKLTCPVFDEDIESEKQEKQRMRKLKAEDLLYFENEIIDVIKELI